jgi:Na+-driven multidrug efflux pump
LTVNIVANLILVPRFGINGAAASSSISYGLTAIVTLAVFQRLSGRSIVETLVIRPSDLRAARGLLEAVVRRLRGGRGEDIEVPGSETAAEIVLAEREPGEEA